MDRSKEENEERSEVDNERHKNLSRLRDLLWSENRNIPEAIDLIRECAGDKYVIENSASGGEKGQEYLNHLFCCAFWIGNGEPDDLVYLDVAKALIAAGADFNKVLEANVTGGQGIRPLPSGYTLLDLTMRHAAISLRNRTSNDTGTYWELWQKHVQGRPEWFQGILNFIDVLLKKGYDISKDNYSIVYACECWSWNLVQVLLAHDMTMHTHWNSFYVAWDRAFQKPRLFLDSSYHVIKNIPDEGEEHLLRIVQSLLKAGLPIHQVPPEVKGISPFTKSLTYGYAEIVHNLLDLTGCNEFPSNPPAGYMEEALCYAMVQLAPGNMAYLDVIKRLESLGATCNSSFSDQPLHLSFLLYCQRAGSMWFEGAENYDEKKMIEFFDHIMDTCDDMFHTEERTLHMVCATLNPTLVERYLERGGTKQINTVRAGMTPLMYLFSFDRLQGLDHSRREMRLEIVGLLLDAGADIDATCAGRGRDKTTALLCATFDSPEGVQLLIERGVSMKLGSSNILATLLYYEDQNPEVLQILFQHLDKFDLTEKYRGSSPLTSICNAPYKVATSPLYMELAKRLIHAGVSPLNGSYYDDPVTAAIQKGSFELLDLILEGVDVEDLNVDYICDQISKCFESITTVKRSRIKGLFCIGAGGITRTLQGQQLLVKAAAEAPLDVLEWILEYFEINEVSIKDVELTGVSLLAVCIRKRGVDAYGALSMLLRWDLNCNMFCNSCSCTPLMASCRYGDIKCTQLLVSRGANVNFTENSEHGRTVLMYACMFIRDSNELIATVLCLIEAGAKLHAISHRGENIFHVACAQGNSDLVMLLTQFRSWHVSPQKRQYLLNMKEVNSGRTPLHFAVMSSCSTEAILSLVKCGANPSTLDSENRSPIVTSIDYRYDLIEYPLYYGDYEMEVTDAFMICLRHEPFYLNLLVKLMELIHINAAMAQMALELLCCNARIPTNIPQDKIPASYGTVDPNRDGDHDRVEFITLLVKRGAVITEELRENATLLGQILLEMHAENIQG